jgi:hypothetical protein
LAGLGILLVLALVHGAFQSYRVTAYKAKAVAAQQRATELTGALGAANALVDRLNGANEKLIKAADLQKQMLRDAAARLEKTSRELAKWKAGITVKEDRDHALPDCKKLLAADLGVCPGHVDGMRARAHRLP